jgi:5'-nucleotidase
MPRRVTALAALTVFTLGLGGLAVSPAAAADVTHSIADVQGDGAATPLSGSVVTVEGVVTGDYRNATASGYKGFYLQTPGADETPGRSDGIFVYANTANPGIAIGDLVRVTGTAGEYQGQTQITATAVGAYELIDDAVGVPASTVLPNSVVGTAREAYEGMLVTPESAFLSSSHQLYNFGTLWLGVGSLPVKATETTDAGAEATAIGAANRASRLLLDDGYSIQVTNAAHPGTQPYFTEDVVVRNGDEFVSPDAGMILGWGFDDWRLQPQKPLSSTTADLADFSPTWGVKNPRTATPEDVGGDLQIGAFNVFNYFTTFGGDARGAANAEEFAIQQAKIVSAINALGSDVVALMEIENSVKLGEAPDEALADLVGALNADAGAGTWDYVATPEALLDAATTDFITNAIIYKPAAVTPVGDSFADIDESVWDIAREPLAQTFTTTADDKVITVIANHFKSKSPPSGNTAPEPADLQGFFNAERVEQAQSLADFIATIESDPAKGENVIALGDFNAYHQEDPAQLLQEAGLVDLVPEETDEYTYTFDGELGSLDHAFVSEALAASVTGVDVWNINSPEWSDRGYEYDAVEPGSPYRSSDHDPITVGISTEPVPVDIDILSINDFHGRLEASTPSAGAAVIGGMVNHYKAENPNSIFVGAGDFIGASTFTSFIQNDEPTIDALNEIGLETSAFGNHEFDQGREDVDERIIPHADWDYLSANIYDRATGEPAYQQYDLKEFDGVTVGFIGAMTEELTTLVSPDGIASLEVREVEPEINRVADQLSDGDAANGEADVIVLLVHEGAATTDIVSATDDSAFGNIVTGANENIDAIVSGHTHLAYNHDVAIPGTDRTRPVLSSGQYGEKFSHMSLSVNPSTGELLDISAEILPLFGAYEPDPEVAAIVADAVAVAKELGSVKVGDVTADLNRAKQTAAGSENRGGESTIGNFVADVHLWATQDNGADLAVMNPGGIRADLKYASSSATDPAGNVTFSEAAAVQPFANTLVTVDLTGAQLMKVLEEQWQPAGSSRPFLKLGVSDNVRYTYDPDAAAGSHITAVYVNDVLVTDSDVFTVAANSFLTAGGDNFVTFREGTNKADTGKADLQSMVDYFTATPVVSPDLGQRAVGVTVTAPEELAAGDEVTLDISSLLFSNGEPTATSVVVSAGDTELATGTIDPAIVDTTDEVGRSTVTFTVPDGTPAGALELTITVPGTPTTASVTLEVTSTDEPITSVTAPTITGQGRVGRTLTATPGTWSVENPTIAYQWNRDGVAIDGATASTYRVTAADAGAQVTVTVTASADGYTDGVATSAEKTIAKISTTTSGALTKHISFGASDVSYKVVVRAGSDVEPTGVVTIYDGGTAIATVTLEEGDDGRATVPLGRLSRGLHFVTAKFAGTEQLASSTSLPDLYLRF